MIMNEEALNLLKRIGLNQYESRTYSALLSSGTSTAGELSEVADVPRSRVYDVLTSLEKKGFAVIQVGRPVKYLAVPPGEAIKRVQNNHEEDYKRKINSFDSLRDDLKDALEPMYDHGKELVEPSEIVGMLRGRVNVYNQIKQLIGDSKESIVKVTDHNGLRRLEKHCISSLEKAKRKGVKTKVLVRNSKKAGESLSRVGKHAELKEAKNLEGRFLVKDGKEAIIITSTDEAGQDVGLWIKSPYLANWLEQLFAHAWEQGSKIGA